MKNTWKYILIGLSVVVIEWIFLGVFHAWFNGLDQTGAGIAKLMLQTTFCMWLTYVRICSLKKIYDMKQSDLLLQRTGVGCNY